MTSSALEFGVILSQFSGRWDHVMGDVRIAEDDGLDSVWLVDHLQGVADPSRAIFEAWTALAAIAGATERIRLGHLVNCVSFRNVGLLAKMACTVDHASAGRLELGLGAGWHQSEYEAFGYPFPTPAQRYRAFSETLEALISLFAGGPVDYDGEFVSLKEAYCSPGPVQQPHPPIVVGTAGKKMRALTGRLADTWNCPAGLLPQLAETRAVVMDAAGDRPVRTTVQIHAAVGRNADEVTAARIVADQQFSWSGDLADVAILGTIDEGLEQVATLRAAGVDGFIGILPGSRMRPAFMEAWAELARRARTEII